MQSLIKCLIDICLLRAAPQDLPASPRLMWLCLGAYLLSNLALSSFDAGLGRGMLMAVADSAVLAAFLRLALRWRGHAARFVQTFTALANGVLLGLGYTALSFVMIQGLMPVSD